MADSYVYKTTFQFKRGHAENWTKLNPVLSAGEPGFEIDTYKLKIGDGQTAWNDLEYFDEDGSGSAFQICRGYYYFGKFYTDSTYQVELPCAMTYIYIDQNSNGTVYTWSGEEFQKSIQDASETQAGIVKLYTTGGQNIDGTMTQKAITNAFGQIGFDVDEVIDECLVFDNNPFD